MSERPLTQLGATSSMVSTSSMAMSATSSVGGDELEAPRAKKPRAAKIETPETTADWLVLHERGSLGGLTNPVLKGYCTSNKLPVGGKKDDLVERISAHLAERATEEAALVAAQAAE